MTFFGIAMMKSKTPKSFGTHDGTFHADEVTACALLLFFKLIDRDKIHRTRDEAILSHCEFVCDVGGAYDPSQKLFDHHQAEYTGPKSSAGMILDYLHALGILSKTEHDFLELSVIKGVDAHDNGIELHQPGVCTYSNIIASFTPVPQDVEPSIVDAAFFQAVEFAENYFSRILHRYHYLQDCREIVMQTMKKNGNCLMFDKNIPWLETFFELGGESHEAQFVIMPSGNHWKLRGVPPSWEERMKVRIPLPLEWAGHLGDDLKRISGIPGAVFCHKGRFISVWETQADALKALDYTMKMVQGRRI